MSRTAAALVTLIILAAAVFGLLIWQQGRVLDVQLPVQTVEPAAEAVAPAAPAEPEIKYPIAVEEPIEEPLPALDKSDDTFSAALGGVVGPGAFRDLFFPQSIVRRIVVTIDNLPREIAADRLRPVKPAQGGFRIQKEGAHTYVAADNSRRYAPYVNALERMDIASFNKLYVRFYPLFQSAYRDLGYPKGYFNDRLVEVIDHMLAAPELEGPVPLVQPHVFYRYADPAMESASAGHKLMWRMGNENAARVKAKLLEIRAAVTANPIKQDAAAIVAR